MFPGSHLTPTVTPEILLGDPLEWTVDGRATVRGSAFVDGSTELWDAARIAARLCDCRTREDLMSVVDRLEGLYAVILEGNGETFLVVDHVRSRPLFYMADGSAVGDGARPLVGDVDPSTFGGLQEAEYLLCMYVTGPETLHPDLRTVEAGQVVTVDHETGQAVAHQHTTFLPQETATPATQADLEAAVEVAIERLCRYADGRPIYVLLSGGLDSRIILLGLLARGYGRVRALSFGRADAADVSTSRWVASVTGVDWEYVEYDAATWREWFHSEERERYYRTVHNLDSVPGFQAGPALSQLRARGSLPDDAVFVTGQTIAGTGGHLPSDPFDTRADLVEYILEHHYNLWRRDEDLTAAMRERVDRSLPETAGPDSLSPAYEHWEWKERQAKFLSQDGFIYSHWGYDWWFPLFDPVVVDAWERLSLDRRRGKAALADAAANLFESVVGDETRPLPAAGGETRLDRVKMAVGNSPVGDVVAPIYRWVRDASGQSHPLTDYDPLGYHGILDESQPGEYFSGVESMWSYVVMHATGRMSFDPPDASGVPADCILSRSAFE
jgi:asparagine synthase (glutamine-hydrolysing)